MRIFKVLLGAMLVALLFAMGLFVVAAAAAVFFALFLVRQFQRRFGRPHAGAEDLPHEQGVIDVAASDVSDERESLPT